MLLYARFIIMILKHIAFFVLTFCTYSINFQMSTLEEDCGILKPLDMVLSGASGEKKV